MRLSISIVAILLSAASLTAQSSDRIDAEGGEIVFTPIIHASVQVEYAGKVIQVDAWSAGDLSGAKSADLFIVTDDPGHHLDPTAIEQLRKPGAPVVLTATGLAKFAGGSVLSNGETGVLAGISMEVVPEYDLTPATSLASEGRVERLCHHPGGKADLFRGAGGVCAGDPGAP